MRTYLPEPPDPNKYPKKFNEYLRDRNHVIEENSMWILIKNSYVDNQLVLWAKQEISSFQQVSGGSFALYKQILKPYDDYHRYVNAVKDKSVPDRYHVHIKL